MAAQGLRLVDASEPKPKGQAMSVGGVVTVMGNAALDERNDAAKRAMEEAQNRPELRGLAAYVRRAWDLARDYKQQNVNDRLLSCQRRRNGIYDNEVLEEIRRSGGSAIWMHITSAKCRAAKAWLQDTILGTGAEKPWTLEPTPIAELSPDHVEDIIAAASAEIEAYQAASGGVMPPDAEVREFLLQMRERMLVSMQEDAARGISRMEKKMEDQVVEGGWLKAFDSFLDDLVTYPFAILKGPVIRSRPVLQWKQVAGQYVPVQGTELRMEWERVSPFDFYWAPHASNPEEGYCVEHHRMTRGELNQLIGVDGYDEEAIRQVLRQHGEGGLREWTSDRYEREQIEGKGNRLTDVEPDGVISALQYHGSVMGQMLIDWGMPADKVEDPEREYNVECWLIGTYVIKAKINYDPMGRKPYYKSCYEKIPGQFCGNGVPDLIRDDQDMANSAARALANNMGMSSGPQVAVNVDRLPDGEDLTQMYPWKIWQFTNDMSGGNAAPIQFFAPPSMAPELMGVYEKFSAMADEHSGIARYMQGDTNMGTIGRSATGVTAVMGAASKIIKQVVMNIDIDVTQPSLEFLYYFNMRYGTDPELKRGDIKIRARGAISLIQKEAAQQRRNEFLQLTLNSPVVQQVMGQDGIAQMLREMASTLDFRNVNKIIPTVEVLKQRQAEAMMQQQQAMLQQQAAAEQPQQSIKAKYDENGQFVGADVMNKPGQQLPNGQPVANTFAPMGGA